jgi:two-component system, OmpR family, sensor kinase
VKLSTRLALVVSAILAITTIITSTQSVLVHRNEKLSTYKSVLNNLYNQLNESKEDDIALALYIAEQSPIPMSLAYVSENSTVNYLLENAGSSFVPSNKNGIRKALKSNFESDGIIQRYYDLGEGNYLAFFLSLSEINKEVNNSFKKILFFNFILIFFAVLLIVFIFRRDSKLNSAAKGMQEFIGDASHELKTPLTVIRGYSELLSKNSENSSKYAERINEESLRMSNIIDQLLKIAALNEGRKGEPTAIDLAEYLKNHIDDILVLQPKRQISFAPGPLVIEAPYELVDTLLSNVLTNARIHSPESAPIKITMTGKQIVIEDGGPGLKEIPDKPFKRFDTSRSRETGGSGLGMSLIQKSAKELGAKLHFAKSELGGLKVEITF